MIEKELYQLYEKLYFHEIDIRDKLNGKLQLPMAILVSLIGFEAYMLRDFFPIKFSWINILFIIIYLFSIVGTILSIYFFRRSLYGYDYELLPYANDTENYKISLIDAYSKYTNCDELVQKYVQEYLYNCYMRGASVNAKQNHIRTMNILKTNKFIMYSVILTFIAFIPFYFAKLM